MKVTVFTDASVVKGSCGYAFYIGCSIGHLKKAGLLKISENSNTTVAELHCLANALYTLKHSKFSSISIVWIFCDCDSVVKTVAGETRSFKSAALRAVVDEIHFLMMEICMKHGKSIRDVDTFFKVQHIKAHTGNDDIRSRINKWCDVEARKYAKWKGSPPPPLKKKKKR